MLIEHQPGLYSADDVLSLPGLHMPVRMTVVRLGDGSLWVHSPIACTPALADAVAALGRVRYLVAPSHLHHLFVGAWALRFPDAEVWAPAAHAHGGETLRIPDVGRVSAHGRGDEPWRHEIDTIPIEGARKFSETVFFHRQTRTLVVSDLLFNLRDVGGWLAWLVLRLMGVRGRLAQSRAWRFAVHDRSAFAACGRRIVALAPTRLMVAHGEVVERLEPDALAHALAWMCRGREASTAITAGRPQRD